MMLPVLLAFFFQPAPAYTISGTVVQAGTQRPLSKVRLSLTSSESANRIGTLVTGADGRFRFTNLPAGDYGLSAERLGFAGQGYGQHVLYQRYLTGIVVGPDHSADNLMFSLIPGGVISGYVRDGQGEPIPGMTVAALRILGTGSGRHVGLSLVQTTDDRGSYRISSLPRGTFAIEVAGKPEFEVASVEPAAYPATFYPSTTDPDAAQLVTVAPGQEAQADVVVRAVPAARIAGEAPAAPPGVQQFVALYAPSLFGSEIPIGPSQFVFGSHFIFNSVPAGHYTLDLVQGTRWIGRQVVDIAAPETKITMNGPPPAKVQLHVQFTAQPSSAVTAGLISFSGTRSYVLPLPEEGMIVLPSLPPGRYVPVVNGRRTIALTSVKAQGASSTGDIVTIPDSGDVEITVLADTTAVDLRGFVRRNGAPQAAAVVMLVQRDRWQTFGGYRYDQSNSDGSFTLHSVPRGEYLLFAFPDGEPADYDDPDVIRKWLASALPVTVNGEPAQSVTVELHEAAARQ